VTQRERERQKSTTKRKRERERQREHIIVSPLLFLQKERERKRSPLDISRGELERSDVFPRATRKERRSGTETLRSANERRDHGED